MSMSFADLFKTELEAIARALVPFVLTELETRGVIPKAAEPAIDAVVAAVEGTPPPATTEAPPA
jgi:hypothetical protein